MEKLLYDRNLFIEILKQCNYEDWFKCMKLSKFHYNIITSNFKLVLEEYLGIIKFGDDKTLYENIRMIHRRLIIFKHIFRTHNNPGYSFDDLQNTLKSYNGNIEKIMFVNNPFNILQTHLFNSMHMGQLNQIQAYYHVLSCWKEYRYSLKMSNEKLKQQSSEQLLNNILEAFYKKYHSFNNFKA